MWEGPPVKLHPCRLLLRTTQWKSSCMDGSHLPAELVSLHIKQGDRNRRCLRPIPALTLCIQKGRTLGHDSFPDLPHHPRPSCTILRFACETLPIS